MRHASLFLTLKCFLSLIAHPPSSSSFFFFNDTATTEIYTLSLHDALPICASPIAIPSSDRTFRIGPRSWPPHRHRLPHAKRDRKSTRLNSSHLVISYAVFCLKKKKKRANSHWRQTVRTKEPELAHSKHSEW